MDKEKRQRFPYLWERPTDDGRERGAYARDNGDGTVTVLRMEPQGAALVEREQIILADNVRLTPARR